MADVPSRVFTPIAIGPMRLRNRIMAPPHAALLGNLLGTEAEAQKYIDYWTAIAEGGTALLTCLNGFVENLVPPGFDPSGVGAKKAGSFRDSLFVERMGRLAGAIHSHGACASTQLIMQGGMPHGPSHTLSGPVINALPHALTRREIRWFVEEYRFSAEQALRAGLDAVELHANHDDLIEWFLSPLTNQRGDEYGGTREKRLAFLAEIIREIRAGVGNKLALGVRLNMDEAEPGGYDMGEGIEIALRLQDLGMVDYLHLVTGTGWGYPSYIQTHHFRPGQWAGKAGEFRRHLKLPVAYAGRVTSIAVAEQIIADGFADLVTIGRAHLADPHIVGKSARGAPHTVRPCIGCNDCINRGVAEGLPFACTVNPSIASGDHAPLAQAPQRKRLLVIGGGPAGIQLAITARERGHEVELWERHGELGGQVLLAAKLPTQEVFLDYVRYQRARLGDLGVRVRLAHEAGVENTVAAGADVVALATGASPRRPAIPGIDDPRVQDKSAVLRDGPVAGARVAIVVQEDHAAPLAMADHLAAMGRAVTLFIQTNGPAPQLSRYSAGTLLGRLSERGVKLVCMEAVSAIELPRIRTRHVYSQRESVHEGFDSVVLACGGVPECALYEALEGRVPELHVLGDAYASRRLVFATQQGHALGKLI